MLQRFIQEFIGYCRLAHFSDRSIQAFTARLKELQSFLKAHQIRSVKKITYLDLVAFVADFNNPSIHVRKSRVWTLRQFYHFLELNNKVTKNIASRLPYPKIEKTVPQFLTVNEYIRLIGFFLHPFGLVYGIEKQAFLSIYLIIEGRYILKYQENILPQVVK
jgi:integrase/recombinase XerC